ncbi:SUMO ligase siz1 [Linnemannia zychae]|nr:SUMO ligase siz1 [Linnemannia zychae]
MMTSKVSSNPPPTHMGSRPQVPHYMSMARPGSQDSRIVFKSSPFYKDIQVLSPARLCMESKDRTMSVALPFTIAPMISVQMKREPEYQIMVFCTSAEGVTSPPALMEFPHVCEIKISGRVLEANLRGMKNKPGTVSPANITRLCRLEPAEYNKVEFIYANSTKRYYASVNLVKKSSVNSIVAEIERGKFLSKDQMLRMLAERNKDDDIMATSSTLSLKCPLGFQRITVPIRSSYCQHLQCFDAYTFFNLNEQTPTWTCPVCSRVMHSWEEIVVDGYFKDLLNSTPESLESIVVQADGSWELPSASSTADNVIAPSPKKKPAPSNDSVFIIDEDEDENGAPVAAAEPPQPIKPAKPAIEIIDLISDSEDEDVEPSATQSTSTATVSTSTAVDFDGDSGMQDAANSLQNMAQATAGPSAAVKTEDLERPAATVENEAVPTAPEAPSIIGSASRSPVASSEASPVVSNRIVQTEPIVAHRVSSPVARTPPVWENSEDMFMNALLNPRKRRQLDDTLDNQNINNISNENRQRMARLDIRSNGSSDRGSSAMPSPDVVRRSTSSPTPVPSFHDPDRIIAADHNNDYDEATLRARRDQMLNRVAAIPYFENGHAESRAPITSTQQPYASIHRSPQHLQNHNSQRSFGRSSRSATMSPPLHQGYNNVSAHHATHIPQQQHTHYHPHHRSTGSPGPDYYSSSSRPPASGHRSEATLITRSNSVGMSRQPSNLTTMPVYGGNSTAWSPPDSGHQSSSGLYSVTGSGDRIGHGWGGEHGSSSHLGGNAHLNHSNSPRRISGDEARGSGAVSPSAGRLSTSSAYTPHSQSQPPPATSSASSSSYHHPPYQSHSQSMQQHQRHRSTDDRWSNQNGGGNGLGGAHYRTNYSTNGDESRGFLHGTSLHPQQQEQSYYQQQQQQQYPSHHVYSSSQGGSNSGGGSGYVDDRRRSDEGVHFNTNGEAPIFPNGIRGARAR